MAYKRKTYKRKAPKARGYTAYKRKAAKKSIKRVVRSVLSRAAETKSVESWFLDKPLYTVGNVNFPDNVFALGFNTVGPTCVQGTGQGNRIGNQVTIKRAILKAVLVPMPQNATTNPTPKPVVVRMALMYDREDENDSFIPGNQLMQSGNGAAALEGRITDMLHPYNNNRYRVLTTRTFKLGFAEYAGTTTSVANQGIFQAYSNNDFKLNHQIKMDVSKYLPKKVKWNDNTSNPVTRGLYALFHYANADGSSLDPTIIAAEISYGMAIDFQDM